MKVIRHAWDFIRIARSAKITCGLFSPARSSKRMDIFHEAFRSFNLRFSYKSPRQKSHLLKLENPAVMLPSALLFVACCI